MFPTRVIDLCLRFGVGGKVVRIDDWQLCGAKPDGWRETRRAYLQQLERLYKDFGVFAPLVSENADSGPLTIHRLKYGTSSVHDLSVQEEDEIVSEERKQLSTDWKYVPHICFHPTCWVAALVRLRLCFLLRN